MSSIHGRSRPGWAAGRGVPGGAPSTLGPGRGSFSTRMSVTHHTGAIHASGQIPSGGSAAQSSTAPIRAWPKVDRYQPEIRNPNIEIRPIVPIGDKSQ